MQTIFVSIAQDPADGEIVSIAAGITPVASRAALSRNLRKAYDALGSGVDGTFSEWVESFTIHDPEAVEVQHG